MVKNILTGHFSRQNQDPSSALAPKKGSNSRADLAARMASCHLALTSNYRRSSADLSMNSMNRQKNRDPTGEHCFGKGRARTLVPGDTLRGDYILLAVIVSLVRALAVDEEMPCFRCLKAQIPVQIRTKAGTGSQRWTEVLREPVSTRLPGPARAAGAAGRGRGSGACEGRPLFPAPGSRGIGCYPL